MRKLRRIDLYIIPLFFVLIASVILRTVALFTSFNTGTMHFDDKILITISNILVAISCIGFASYLIFGEKERELIAKSNNARSYIPAGIVSTALLFFGADNIGKIFDGTYVADPLPAMATVCAILAFLSVVSFFLTVFVEHNDNMFKAAFSLCIVLCLAIYATMLFFNKQSHPTNSPNKLVDQFAYLSAALFFLFESRICIGRTIWRGYVAFGLISTLLCAYSAIPSLILYLANGYVLAGSLAESVLTLSLAALICSKVLQIPALTPDCESDAARSITMLAIMRESEMEEQRKLSRAQDINKMEENDTEDASNYTFDIPEVEPKTDFSTDSGDSDYTETI